jgi:hypothetical protein
MRKILQKIAWKTNNWTTKISLFSIYLGGDNQKFGFQILNIDRGFIWSGSLFEITWHFPTITHAGELTIDILFLFKKWNYWCINMDERVLWGSGLSRWERINRYIHDKLNQLR